MNKSDDVGRMWVGLKGKNKDKKLVIHPTEQIVKFLFDSYTFTCTYTYK